MGRGTIGKPVRETLVGTKTGFIRDAVTSHTERKVGGWVWTHTNVWPVSEDGQWSRPARGGLTPASSSSSYYYYYYYSSSREWESSEVRLVKWLESHDKLVKTFESEFLFFLFFFFLFSKKDRVLRICNKNDFLIIL